MSHRLERLCLRHGSGKSIEDKAIFAILILKTLVNELYYKLVGNELALIRIGKSFESEGSLCFDGSSDDVARGY